MCTPADFIDLEGFSTNHIRKRARRTIYEHDSNEIFRARDRNRIGVPIDHFYTVNARSPNSKDHSPFS